MSNNAWYSSILIVTLTLMGVIVMLMVYIERNHIQPTSQALKNAYTEGAKYQQTIDKVAIDRMAEKIREMEESK